MYQGPTQAAAALETGGNLERIYETLSRSQTDLFKAILIELRVQSQVLQDGLNTRDDLDGLRESVEEDKTLITSEG